MASNVISVSKANPASGKHDSQRMYGEVIRTSGAELIRE